jgi:hypothetical protein
MKLRWLALPVVAGVGVAGVRSARRAPGRHPGPGGPEDGSGPGGTAGLEPAAIRTTAAGDVESEDRSGQWADDGGGGAGGGQRPTTVRLGRPVADPTR